MGVIGLIVGQVMGVKDACHRVARALLDRGKNCRDAGRVTAVVADCLYRALHRIAGGDRGCQHKDMLARDHGGRVLTEKKLAAGGMLRRDHIDRLVRVHIC